MTITKASSSSSSRGSSYRATIGDTSTLKFECVYLVSFLSLDTTRIIPFFGDRKALFTLFDFTPLFSFSTYHLRRQHYLLPTGQGPISQITSTLISVRDLVNQLRRPVLILRPLWTRRPALLLKTHLPLLLHIYPHHQS